MNISLQKAKKSPYWEDSKEDTTPSCDNDCKGGGDYDVCAIDVEDGKYEILRYKNPCRAKCAGEVKQSKTKFKIIDKIIFFQV